MIKTIVCGCLLAGSWPVAVQTESITPTLAQLPDLSPLV